MGLREGYTYVQSLQPSPHTDHKLALIKTTSSSSSLSSSLPQQQQQQSTILNIHKTKSNINILPATETFAPSPLISTTSSTQQWQTYFDMENDAEDDDDNNHETQTTNGLCIFGIIAIIIVTIILCVIVIHNYNPEILCYKFIHPDRRGATMTTTSINTRHSPVVPPSLIAIETGTAVEVIGGDGNNVDNDIGDGGAADLQDYTTKPFIISICSNL